MKRLIDLVRAGDQEGVAVLLAAGGDANARLRNGDTPLLWAAIQGGAAVVRLLLERGADPNAYPDGAQNPLAWAAYHGNADAAADLGQDAGVDPGTDPGPDRGADGYTFIEWAEGGAAIGTANPIDVTVDADRTITANFTAAVTGSGTVWTWYPPSSPRLYMEDGQMVTYFVDVPPPDGPKQLIGPVVTGATNSSKGYVTWQYPDGTYETRGDANVEGNGMLIAAIPVIPVEGRHVFKIFCTSNGSIFLVRVEAYN